MRSAPVASRSSPTPCGNAARLALVASNPRARWRSFPARTTSLPETAPIHPDYFSRRDGRAPAGSCERRAEGQVRRWPPYSRGSAGLHLFQELSFKSSRLWPSSSRTCIRSAIRHRGSRLRTQLWESAAEFKGPLGFVSQKSSGLRPKFTLSGGVICFMDFSVA
jgi:hypothetical protein